MSQQSAWELLDHVIKGWEASGDNDEAFLKRVKATFAKTYQGVRVGSWGQIQGECYYTCETLRLFTNPVQNGRWI